MDLNDDIDSDFSLSESFTGLTSTPKSKKPQRGTINKPKTNFQFKVPQPVTKKKRPQKSKPKLVCNDCGKIYVCAGYYKNHTRNHTLQAATERYPNKEKVTERLSEIANTTLDAVINSPPGGDVIECAQHFKEVNSQCVHFGAFSLKVCDIYLDSIITKKFMLPSKLLEALVKQCDYTLSTSSLRSELITLLSSSRPGSSVQVLNFFLCEYVVCFCEVLLKFIAKSVHEEPVTREKPYECDTEDRQTIHYIAGAILRGYYKRSKRYPNSPMWKAVKETIIHRFAENSNVQFSAVEDKSWTEKKDRGALIFVGDTCLEFFVLLSEIIELTEEPNGSISYMKVYEKVCNSMASTVYWDSMVSDSLTEDVSLLFLRALIKSFCQTYGRGISKRRINKIREQPEASVNLRHSLARKVNA